MSLAGLSDQQQCPLPVSPYLILSDLVNAAVEVRVARKHTSLVVGNAQRWCVIVSSIAVQKLAQLDRLERRKEGVDEEAHEAPRRPSRCVRRRRHIGDRIELRRQRQTSERDERARLV